MKSYILARKTASCPACSKKIERGDRIAKLYASKGWVHYNCLPGQLNINDEDGYAQRLQEYRAIVVSAVGCPKCTQDIGQKCRDLGRLREELHAQRKRAYKIKLIRDQETSAITPS